MKKVFLPNELDDALRNYQSTDIISFPTDTVYGIGANLFNEDAIRKIYQTKHRPNNKPIAVLCNSKEQMLKVVKEIPKEIEVLIYHFMPGALTVVLPKKDNIPDFLTSNLPTVGVRIPNHQIALHILKPIGPLATTSANLSGEANLNSGEDVINQLGEDIDIIINGGITDIGIPSTVVSVIDGKLKIIRLGAISQKEIEEVLKTNY